jgi:hypothetical protein
MIKSKKATRVRHVALMGEKHKYFVRKPQGKGPLGRLRRRWNNNIKQDFREIV